MKAKSEDRAEYAVGPAGRKMADDETIAQALLIIKSRLRKPGECMHSPQAVRDYLSLTLATREAEAFWCIWLDAQNRLISAGEMFTGTLTQTAVYPREIIKAALAHNAAAVILAHNHPSGLCEPSRADELLTQNLKAALAYIDCKVLDHMIVAGGEVLSFAERGLI